MSNFNEEIDHMEEMVFRNSEAEDDKPKLVEVSHSYKKCTQRVPNYKRKVVPTTKGTSYIAGPPSWTLL